MVPPIRSIPRTLSRVRGRLFAAIEAGSPGSISRKPCQPRRNPITSQPRSSADKVTERMQGFNPGTSPPPVRIPIFIAPDPSGAGPAAAAPDASGAAAEVDVERLRSLRNVDLGAVERHRLLGLQLRDRRGDRPF